MVKLINKSLKNKPLVTKWGKVQFDAEGVAEVNEEVAEMLTQLNGYSVEGEDSTSDDSKQQNNENNSPDESKNDPDEGTKSDNDDDQQGNGDNSQDDEQQQNTNDNDGEQQQGNSDDDDDQSPQDDEEKTGNNPDEGKETADISNLNVPQLRKYAKDNNITIPASAKTKDEILKAIEKASK